MLKIKELTENARLKQIYSKNIGGYIFEAICEYNSTQEVYTVDLNCKIQERGLKGSVQVVLYKEQFVSNGTIFFKDLEVPTPITRRGVGTMLMNGVLYVGKAFQTYYGMSQKIILLGDLSRFDYRNGNWEKSIPFYEKFSKTKGINMILYNNITNNLYNDGITFLKEVKDEDSTIAFEIK